jgi:hypothetical protein
VEQEAKVAVDDHRSGRVARVGEGLHQGVMGRLAERLDRDGAAQVAGSGVRIAPTASLRREPFQSREVSLLTGGAVGRSPASSQPGGSGRHTV